MDINFPIYSRIWFISYHYSSNMKPLREIFKDIIKIGTILFVLLYASGIFNQINPTTYVEIRDYQGVNLGSISDFRENSIKGPQYVDNETYLLKVKGLVSNPGNYTYSEVLDYDHLNKIVTIYCVEGWDVKILWEGVRVMDILNDAGLDAEADTVIFHAYDGYTTSIPIDFIQKKNLILAYKMNDAILPPERGFPFQLVAEEKWGYKWIKWVTEIEVSDDADYKGYWESRGYSNSADLDEGFYD